MVRIENLAFSYRLKGKSLPVLSAVDAVFERGAITAIVGRSGCGKTSLLRVIAGLSAPTSGRVSVDGDSRCLVREGTSIIFQDFGLLPWASVQTNAELGLRARGVPASLRKSKVDSILAELELGPFARLYPARLSGGMRQRVAVARALAAESDLLLLDEPFSSLDALSRENLQDTLLETQRRHGTTVIIVTHSIEEAAYLADTVYILEGKNPSTLSVRFDTGRRKGQEPAARDTRSGEVRSGASGDKQPGEYRESDHFFSNIAALRRLFSGPAPEDALRAATPLEAAPRAAARAAAGSPDESAAGWTDWEGSGTVPASHRAASFFARAGKIALAASFIALVWAALAALLKKPFLPMPSVAVGNFLAKMADGTLPIHVGASLRRIFLALALAGPPAWALGLLSGRMRTADALASPLVYLLHPLPKVAFLPILMLFFGLGDASKVALMGLVVFGQLFVGARDSARAIPSSLIDTVRSLGLGKTGILRHAILPATMPSLLSSLRISLGTAIAVLFLSETFASMDGLGWYIMDSWSRVDYPDMYAAIIALSLLGLALYLALDAVEAFALRWRETD